MDWAKRREAIQSFVRTEIVPNVDEWEMNGTIPIGLRVLAGKLGILALGQPDWRDDVQRFALPPIAEMATFAVDLAASGSQSVAMALSAHFVSLKLLSSGEPDVFREVAEGVLSGRDVINLALTEPQAGSDLRTIATRAVQQTDRSWSVTGKKVFVCNAPVARWIIVNALDGETQRLFLVELGGESDVEPLRPLGWRALPIGHVTLRAAAATPIGETGSMRSRLQDALATERINLAAIALSSARIGFANARDYAVSRTVGGQALMTKQAIAHRLADLRTELESARSLLDALLSNPARPTLFQVAVAKNTATTLLERVAREAVQINGAQGCFEPNLAERLYRDAKLLSIGGGSEEMMREIIVRSSMREDTTL